MKPLRPNKYQSKHRYAHSFHPGNEIVPAENNRVLAYNTQGKTYKRILPPVRNERVIDIPMLCDLLTRLVPQNSIECVTDGIIINEKTLILSEGLAVVGSLKFRFIDLRDLLKNLIQEGILIANQLDVKSIKYRYYE